MKLFDATRSLLTAMLVCAAGLPTMAGAMPVIVYAYSGTLVPSSFSFGIRLPAENVQAPFTDSETYASSPLQPEPSSELAWSVAADYGALSGRATAAATSTPATNAHATFLLGLSFADTVTAVSRSGALAIGTPITLTLNLQVHGTDSYTSSTAYAASQGGITVMAGAGNASVSTAHNIAPATSTSDVFDQTLTESAVYSIGNPFFVSIVFNEAVSTIMAHNESDAASMTVDYLDGINMFLTTTDST